MLEKHTITSSENTGTSLGDALLVAHQAEMNHARTSEAVQDAYTRFQRGEITGADYARISSGAEASELGVQAARKAVNREVKREDHSHPSIKRRLASFIMHH